MKKDTQTTPLFTSVLQTSQFVRFSLMSVTYSDRYVSNFDFKSATHFGCKLNGKRCSPASSDAESWGLRMGRVRFMCFLRCLVEVSKFSRCLIICLIEWLCDNWLGKQLQHCMAGFTHFTPHGGGSVLTCTNSIQREDNKTTRVAGSAAMRSLSVWHRGTLEMGIQIETKSKACLNPMSCSNHDSNMSAYMCL